jgi:iron complex outermembrane receptor protein
MNVILSGAATHSRVYDVPLLVGTSLTATVQPTYAPPYQADLALRYSHDFHGGTLSETFNTSYSDGWYYNLRNFAADRFPHYFKENIGVSWIDGSGHWEGALNVENLSDAHIGNIGYDLASFCGCNTVSYQLPRFVSFDLRYNL